jgi:hypothetical protein
LSTNSDKNFNNRLADYGLSGEPIANGVQLNWQLRCICLGVAGAFQLQKRLLEFGTRIAVVGGIATFMPNPGTIARGSGISINSHSRQILGTVPARVYQNG